MTLQDLIAFLHDEAQEQTLTETAIARCILLAYEMGRADAPPLAPTRCVEDTP